MKKELFILATLLSGLVLSCRKGDKSPFPFEGAHHPTKIAIVSDIHYMHPSLLGENGAAGLAFQNYLNQDPKLVEYSDAIFRRVLAGIVTTLWTDTGDKDNNTVVEY